MTSLVWKGYDPLLCLSFASLGNILGSILNYLAGFYSFKFLFEKYLKSKKEEIEKGIFKLKQWGHISLFFAWMPIIGDPLTLAAGVLKINFYYFLLAVSIGKILRYVLLITFALP